MFYIICYPYPDDINVPREYDFCMDIIMNMYNLLVK